MTKQLTTLITNLGFNELEANLLPNLPAFLALQVHSGPGNEAEFSDLMLREL